jgi:hypothetical protein
MKRLACVLLAFVLCGCATAPLTLNPETTENIHKIAIVTSSKKDELSIMNHLIGSNYIDSFGLTGLLLDVAILTDQQQTSLGGSPKALKEKIGLFPIKIHVDNSLAGQLSKRYQIVDLSSFINNMQKQNMGKDKKIDEMISYCKDIRADTLLTVDFIYGLAVYSGDMASAAIDSYITVFDVKSKKVLLKRAIMSDLYYKEGYSVDEYAAEDGKLFKENIVKAARALSLLIGYEFDIDVEYVDKTKRVLPVNAVHVTCKKPYLLEQDCSNWSGAKRKILIDDYQCKIASSDDGTVILIMTSAKTGEATEEELRSPTSHLLTKANNRCLELISSELSKHEITILKTVEMELNLSSYLETCGYFLELDGDGYSILKQFTK